MSFGENANQAEDEVANGEAMPRKKPVAPKTVEREPDYDDDFWDDDYNWTASALSHRNAFNSQIEHEANDHSTVSHLVEPVEISAETEKAVQTYLRIIEEQASRDLVPLLPVKVGDEKIHDDQKEEALAVDEDVDKLAEQEIMD